MSEPGIVPITMPKWGLSMVEGRVVGWLVDEGAQIAYGDPILDIETDKIANTFEALDAGTLRRKVAQPDQTLPIGALLGVLADTAVPDAAINAYVQEFLASFVPPPVADETAGPDYQWVEAGGHRLRYSRLGDHGPTVILVHGFGGDLDNWLFNHAALAADATVYAIDLPGHGQSSKTVTDGSVEALAAVVVAFMDALAIDAAHLVGHSLGGAIAIAAAATHPARVRSLALLAPAGLGGDINGGYLAGFIAAGTRRELKPHLQQLFANPELVSRKLVDDVLKFKRLDGVDAALRAIAARLHDGDHQCIDLRAALAGLKMPIRVLWGSADRIVPAAHARGLPDPVKVDLIDGAGHMVQMEAAAAVNQRLRELW